MNTALQYAKALQALVQKNPENGKEYLSNLRKSLAKRRHEKMLPRILNEYQKLEIYDERVATYKKVTPHMQKTDQLLQLYKRLVSVK